MKKRFQVCANSLDRKQAKIRKCDVCRGWRMHELPPIMRKDLHKRERIGSVLG